MTTATKNTLSDMLKTWLPTLPVLAMLITAWITMSTRIAATEVKVEVNEINQRDRDQRIEKHLDRMDAKFDNFYNYLLKDKNK